MISDSILTVIVPNIFLLNPRLDKVLANLFHQYSRSILKSFILNKKVYVNGIICTIPDKKIIYGDKLSINIKLNSVIKIDQPENIHLNIVYEDNHILVINKQDNLVVHPGIGNESGTLLNALLYKSNDFSHLPRAGIVHRLDKNTTGLMIIAKNIQSYKKLVQQIKLRLVIREYQAIVYGRVSIKGTINTHIVRNPKKRTYMKVSRKGKEAITHFVVLKNFPFHTHLKINLETGRTHQIRVHMLHANFPLVGDLIYKKKRKFFKNIPTELFETVCTFPRQALHASRLCLYHPITNILMEWNTELPKDILNLIKILT